MAMKKPINVSQGYWDMLTEEGKRELVDIENIADNYYATEAKRQAKARRDRIAEGFAFALVADGYGGPAEVAIDAVRHADALISELDK